MKEIFDDKRILIIYFIVIIGLGLGLSYALSLDSIGMNASMAIVKVDETAYGATTFDSSSLDLKPILDSEVETKTDNVIKIDFTVGGSSENNASGDVIYDIALNDLKLNCELLNENVKWKLVKNGTEISNGSLDYKFDTIVDGRLVLTTIQQDLPDYSTDKDTYDDYTFYMWLSDSCQGDLATCINNNTLEDQTSLLGQSLSGKVEVELYTSKKKVLERNPSDVLDANTCSSDVYRIIYNYNGGTGDVTSKEFKVGDTYGELPTTTRDGYTFGGWYLNKDLTETVSSTDIITKSASHNLYAKWEPITYTIEYMANGGSGTMSSQTVRYGDSITIANNGFTRRGYEFLGWTTKSDGTNDGYGWTGWSGTWKYDNAQYGISDNKLILYARWQVITYTVNYDVNGGNETISSQTVQYGNNITISTDTVTRKGYTFGGWYDPTNVSWTNWSGTWSYINGQYGISNNSLTLIAKWTPNTYTVNYSCGDGGGTSPMSQTATYDQTFTVASNTCTKEGYTFAGWYDPTDVSWTGRSGKWTYDNGQYGISSNSLTLTAKWNINTYTVSYDANGGTGAPSAQTKTYGETLTLSLTEPTKENYVFIGWSTDSAATTATYDAGGSYTTNAAVTLYAVWGIYLYNATPGSYVAYTGNNGCTGSACSGQNVNYVSDSDMGYCYYSDNKFSVNGWRIGYSSDNTAYLVSAGAPECIYSSEEVIGGSERKNYISSATTYRLSSQLNYSSNFILYSSSTYTYPSDYSSMSSKFACSSVGETTTSACASPFLVDANKSYLSFTKLTTGSKCTYSSGSTNCKIGSSSASFYYVQRLRASDSRFSVSGGTKSAKPLEGYFTCKTKSTTCGVVYYITGDVTLVNGVYYASYISFSLRTSTYYYNVSADTSWLYGSSYTYDSINNRYVLSDTASLNWADYSSIENTYKYTCGSATANECREMSVIQTSSTATKKVWKDYVISPLTSSDYISDMNNAAIKYCNPSYSYGGVCDSNSAWSINSTDFANIIGNSNSLGAKCLWDNTAECGYGNDLIDIGGYYWLATSNSGYEPYDWNASSRYVDHAKAYYPYGLRPILRLDTDVVVIGGSGTYVDPYVIDV